MSELNINQKIVTNQHYPYPCFICGARFKIPNQVGKHVEENHLEKRKRAVCDICGKVLLTSSGLIKHQKSHRNEKSYACAFCQESFVQWAQRQRHEKQHVKSNVYQCNECEVFFPRLESLEEHNQLASCLNQQLFCCDQLFSKRPQYAEHQLINHRHTRRRRYVEHKCTYCEAVFGTLEDVQDHKKTAHKELCTKKCSKCNREITDVNYDAHFKRCNGRVYKTGGSHVPTRYKSDPSIYKSLCRVCNVEYTNQEDLVEHRKSHPPSCKTFLCKICGNCCSQGSRTFHYLQHSGLKKFTCAYDSCNKSFFQKQNLKLHERTHTNERPYVCKICGKTYVHPSSFREHSFVHSGERPYKCNFCDKAFFRYSGFQSHERTHTGEKPLECKICHRFFAVHATLNAHVKRHYNPLTRIRRSKEKVNRQQMDETEENWVCEQLTHDESRGQDVYMASLEYAVIP